MLFNLFKKESNSIENWVKEKYFSNNKNELAIYIKESLINSFSTFEYIDQNISLNKYHKIDKDILKKVFLENIEFITKYIKINDIENYVEYLKPYHNKDQIKSIFIQNFQLCLEIKIITYINHHNKGINYLTIIKDQYLQKTNNKIALSELYFMSLKNMNIEKLNNYEPEKDTLNVVKYVDDKLIDQINKRNKNKRRLASDVKSTLKQISKIETNGIKHKTYYPFYEKKKQYLSKFLNTNKYAFYLKRNEVNTIAKILSTIYKIKDRENIKFDLKRFFSNDYFFPLDCRIKTLKKTIIYLIYKLHLKDKCDVLFLLNKLQEASQKKPFITLKAYNYYKKEFEIGNYPAKKNLVVRILTVLKYTISH